MIESAVKPVSNAVPNSPAQQVKVESSEKLAQIGKNKEGNQKNEITNDPNSIGMNLDTESLSKLNQELNKLLKQKETEFEYAVDEDTKKLIFRLRDKETKEVVNQFPPEELLNFAKRIMELLDGKIVNMKV